MKIQEAYHILGVNSSDSAEIIKKQYKKLALEYHPDKHAGDNVDWATKKMQEINEAYETIIHSRDSVDKDFDWGITIKVVRPEHPKGPRNPNGYFIRSKFMLKDFRNLWNVAEEDESTFLCSFLADIHRKLRNYSSRYDVLFSSPIITRLMLLAAAEYIDPIASLCAKFDVRNLATQPIYTMVEISHKLSPDDINKPLSIQFDNAVLQQPCGISFLFEDGRHIDYGDFLYGYQLKFVCIWLLNKLYGVTAFGEIAEITESSFFDFYTRKRVHSQIIKIKLQFHFNEHESQALFSPFNASVEIESLVHQYKKATEYVGKYFEDRCFTFADTEALFNTMFAEHPNIRCVCKPIYEVTYRVFQDNTPEIDGKAYCEDIEKLQCLPDEIKELVCYIYGSTCKYEWMDRFSKSKSRYYIQNVDNRSILLRTSRKKDPNGDGYWHIIKIQIIDGKICD